MTTNRVSKCAKMRLMAGTLRQPIGRLWQVSVSLVTIHWWSRKLQMKFHSQLHQWPSDLEGRIRPKVGKKHTRQLMLLVPAAKKRRYRISSGLEKLNLRIKLWPICFKGSSPEGISSIPIVNLVAWATKMASLASKIKHQVPIPTGMPLSSLVILLGMRMRCLRRIRRLSTRLGTRRRIKTSWLRISAYTSDWLKSSLASRGTRLWTNLNRPRKQWTAAILSVAQVESNRDACLPPPTAWAVTLVPRFSPPRSSSRDPLSAACNDAWVNPSSQSSLRN